MDHFSYRSGQLHCEDVSVDELASKLGTPLYVYSKRTLVEHYTNFVRAFRDCSPGVRFSIKSCWNVNILRVLGELGAGMDVVSGGELYRALQAGIDPEKIVAAGVGKTEQELEYILRSGVGWLNVESEQEFEIAAAMASKLGVRGRAALRVNPDVSDPRTHAKTTTGKRGSKFGIDIDRVEVFFKTHAGHPNLSLEGLHAHLGSPIFEADPYLRALDRLLPLIDSLAQQGIKVTSLNLGGGFAADYDAQCPSWQTYADPITEKLAPFLSGGGSLLLEPGRTISANSGILLATTQYTKVAGHKNVLVLDTGMTDLLRPALYDAYHFIWPTRVAPGLEPKGHQPAQAAAELTPWDVVGPICETGDRFAQDRPLPTLSRGARVALFTTGAYGMVQSSNYNSRPRPAEVLVDGAHATLIRSRETYADLVAPELTPERVL